jgi:hypothetical protein
MTRIARAREGRNLGSLIGAAIDPNAGAAERNPLRAIRRMCLACCGNSVAMVADCPSIECPLFVWRLGKNPFRALRAKSNLKDKASHA